MSYEHLQEIEGLHPSAAYALTKKLAQELPKHILICDRPYWLRPEDVSQYAEYVDARGDIFRSSIFHEYGLRIVLEFAEPNLNAEKYSNFSYDGEDWIVIGSNLLLSSKCSQCYRFVSDNSFINKDTDYWFRSHYRSLSDKHLDNYLSNGVLQVPSFAISILGNTGSRNPDIRKIIIHGHIESIGNGAFSECENLEEVFFQHNESADSMSNGSGILQGCPNLKNLYFADFDTFEKYSYDVGGPLENGSRLHINGQPIETFLIPNNLSGSRHNCVRNLKGAVGISAIQFEDGMGIIGYSYEIRSKHRSGTQYGITKKGYEEIMFHKYPGLEKNLIIYNLENIDNFLNGDFICGCSTIATSIEEFEKECNASLKSDM